MICEYICCTGKGVILYGFKTSSLRLREERRLRVFENRVLRRIFEPKRDEITGEWRRLHNEELYDLYCSSNIVRVMKIENEVGGACSAYGGEERCIQGSSWGKPEGKRPLGRPRLCGRIILRWIFRKWDVGLWTGTSWLRIGSGGGHL
jgi:hypothetical protein